MAKNYVGMVKWDKATDAIKYGKRAHADWRGYLLGMAIAIGSLALYVYDGVKANKAADEFNESLNSTIDRIDNDMKEVDVNEEEN
jgi:hypothetical protein